MMEPMPHYSWIWGNKHNDEPIAIQTEPLCEFDRFAYDFHETVTDPKTVEQLQCYLISYELTLFVWRWIVPIVIVIWATIKSGLLNGMIAVPLALLFGQFICRFDVTPRCRRMIKAKRGQSVADCINERLNQLNSIQDNEFQTIPTNKKSASSTIN